jgi:enamine deaminase RidA (YjgF/YER057c/UK114 family)
VIRAGRVFVAGATGYDHATMTMPAAVTDQCRNALATIGAALAGAGTGFDDAARVCSPPNAGTPWSRSDMG